MNKAILILCSIFAVFTLFNQLIIAQNCAGQNGDILVANVNDEGAGSLREAIICANNTPGPNAIIFNISGQGPHTIFVGETSGEALPALLDPYTVVDATTQPGYSGIPQIILDGQQYAWTIPINAIWVRADHCEVYGFEIQHFPDDGIDVRSADYVTIGSIGKGNVVHDNGWELDFFPDLPGTGPWEGCGLVIRNGSSNCDVAGNTFQDNEYCGIIIRDGGDGHIIGGTENSAANTISGNAVGIRIFENTTATTIWQNSIYCNDSLAIQLRGNANNFKESPIIEEALDYIISGTADLNDVVEIFVNSDFNCPGAVCQGKTYLGTAVATNGSWSIIAPFANGVQLYGGDVITATATDNFGNTSEFAECKVVTGTSSCTDDNGIIWVTNTNDTGPGSLREAIICANNTFGANNIHFDIPGQGKQVIPVGSNASEALPALLDAATILDATTQPGFGENGIYDPLIVLDGQFADWTAPINAIWVRANYCEIYGLEIINFPDDGIDITDADYVKIGDIDKGNVIYKNGYEEDYFPDAPAGSGPWNGCGIVMKLGASHCEISGNIVGTDYFQNDTSGNEFCGIVVQHGGDYNQIGGSLAGKGNIVANHPIGIRISNNSFATTFSQNNLYCNDSIPILLIGNANAQHPAPLIDSVSTTLISGTSDSFDLVEVFMSIDSNCVGVPCQGSIYLGTSQTVDGLWTLTFPFANGITLFGGEKITAIATDTLGNSSTFSLCKEVVPTCDMVASITNLQHTTCGATNGSFLVEILNGNPPFVFDIGEGETADPQFSNLSSGSYTVLVIDNTGCRDTLEAVINVSFALEAEITELMNATCGEANGSFLINVVNGSPPYTYDIGEGETSNPQFSNLSPGNYSVLVYDDLGCLDTLEVDIIALEEPEAEIIDVINASCNLANGSFTVMASNGASPFSYDIGNGNTSNNVFENLAAGNYSVTVTDGNSCTIVVDTTIVDAGTPEASIINISNEQCEAANGSFTVDASGGTPPYSYDIGDGVTGNPTFNGLSAGDYTVTVSDFTGCTITASVTIINEDFQPIADFSFVVDEATVFLTNNSQGANSYHWDFGDLGVSEDENPIHIYEESNDYLICLEVENACGSDIFCQVVTVEVPLSTVNISGNIAKENGQTIANVTVNCTNTTPFLTLPDGNYFFNDLIAGEDYIIEPVKDINYSNGVSAFDIFLISQHILNVAFLDSPYKIIAADVNNNGTVSSLDLFYMQQVILNIVDTFPNNTSWRFVPDDFVFPDPEHPLDNFFPENIILENLDTNAVDQDFVAIKVGDVNLNANPLSVVETGKTIKFEVICEDLDEDFVLLKFKSNGNCDFVAFQLALGFENSNLEFLVLEHGIIHPQYHFDQIEDKLNMLWYTPKIDLEKAAGYKEILFELKCKKKTAKPNLENLISSHRSNAFDAKGNIYSIVKE